MAKGSFIGFHFPVNTLLSGMAIFDTFMHSSLDKRLEELAQQMEIYAQENAPWEDQTGDAREGLTAEVFKDGHLHGIVLYHTVDYGIWLEVRWSGLYAIIMPTIEHFSGQVFAGMKLEGQANGEDEGDGVGDFGDFED